jgi:DNA-directed RNA polymerase subunit RPC12/RpoP
VVNAVPTPTAPRPGRLVDGRFWCCANCGAKLAEIVGKRAVIRYERRQWSQSLDADPWQACPTCGEVNGLPEGV